MCRNIVVASLVPRDQFLKTGLHYISDVLVHFNMGKVVIVVNLARYVM